MGRVYKNFFSGSQALRFGKEVLYVTERAVFKLTDLGLVLTEIAPGAELEKHVFKTMGFRPAIDRHLSEMDRRIFRPEPMHLAKRFSGIR